MEYNKSEINWLMDKVEKSTDRYIDAEKLLLDILDMPWYKKIFSGKKILSFLKSRNKF